MELEDLRQNWNNSATVNTPAYNLTELLSKKVEGPLNTLKSKYIKQLVLLPAAAIVLIVTNLAKPELRSNPIIWLVIPALLMLTYLYSRNYRLIKKMEQPSEGNLVESLDRQMRMLEANGRRNIRYARALIFLFIGAIELAMANNYMPAFDAWKHTALFIRIPAYALAVFIQPFITNHFYKLNFGQHISGLKELLSQAA